jgi:hypothetical protein
VVVIVVWFAGYYQWRHVVILGDVTDNSCLELCYPMSARKHRADTVIQVAIVIAVIRDRGRVLLLELVLKVLMALWSMYLSPF